MGVEEFKKHEKEVISHNMILDSVGNGNMADNYQIFRSLSGQMIYASTDAGIGENRNDDRVIIKLSLEEFTILDGMDSSIPSKILAEVILNGQDEIEQSVRNGVESLKSENVHKGVCLISVKKHDQTLKFKQAGDCGAMVFTSDGKIKFVADDSSQINQNITILPVDLTDVGIERDKQSLVDTLPNNFISAGGGNLYKHDDVRCEKGDIVILFSDFLWSNFSKRELSFIVKEYKTPEDIFKKISHVTYLKMKSEIGSALSYKGFDSLGEKMKVYYGGDHVPQIDNQSLLLFQM